MVIQVGGHAKVVFDQIENLYTDHVGPIAPVIVQESIEKWMIQLKQENQKPSLRNISGYIELLAIEIHDKNDRNEFINSVYAIQALLHYKQYYNGG